MTKYYRVRSEEQWDWLMQRFEKQSKNIKWENGKKPLEFCPTFNSSVKEKAIYLDGNQLTWGSAKYALDSGYCLIEVSQMMEDEKMEDYVEIKGEGLGRLYDEHGNFAFSKVPNTDIVKACLSELRIPKSLLYPKVPMTEAEKKEFDELKNELTAHIYDLDDLLTKIRASDYPHLYHRLYVADGDGVKSQLEFARAWADPSLIEVIPEDKYWVKCYPTDDCYFYKYEGKILAGVPRVHLERFQFTTDEIVEYHLDGTENIFEKVEVSE